MSELRVWHKPTLRLLDARATAQTDLDAAHVDPNNDGDIASFENSTFGGAPRSGGESHTIYGRSHPRFDHS